ncbi:MAG TPA: glycerophosphodiester phosphodiesterase family protein [bacterium]|nr:glycerophosphodiester phosphodiesterase family protein [bacterium]
MSDFPCPLLLGHRGAAGEAPENTWPAFEKARESGAHGFEIDVLLTRDRIPVCAHDLTLHRIAGGHGAIQSMNFAELSRLDAGSHFHARFAGERIPVLAEVLDRFGGQMILDIEIKGLNPLNEGIEEVVLKLVRERGLLDRVIISSFNPLMLRRVKILEPGVRTGSNYIADRIRELRRVWFAPLLKPYSKHPQPGQVDGEYMRRQQKRGIKVIPWGVNEPEEIKRLLELKVDGIISDFPGRLVELARAREA